MKDLLTPSKTPPNDFLAMLTEHLLSAPNRSETSFFKLADIQHREIKTDHAQLPGYTLSVLSLDMKNKSKCWLKYGSHLHIMLINIHPVELTLNVSC